MKKYLIIAILCWTLGDAQTTYGQSFKRKDLESTIHSAIKAAYSSSVRIFGFDTIRKEQNSAQFSGVVVSAEGHILTAAHATVPGHFYKVSFTDGRECLAEALGRIGFSDKENMPDVAMLKIMDKGPWPYAEMGWSYSLKVNEPCISISYPETLDQKLPSVRFGRIADPLNRWGFIVSTCKMEPGDSGGPLYDYLGRVVGLHSRIDRSEDINLEVPLDLYRKYWTALNEKEDYAKLPTDSDAVNTDPLSNSLEVINGLEALPAQFLSYNARYKGTVVRISSSLKGSVHHSTGTLFRLDDVVAGGRKHNGSYVLAKSSLVGDQPKVNLDGGKPLDAKILSREEASDLVLMELPGGAGRQGIRIKSLSDTTDLGLEQVGRFLVSPLPGAPAKISVLGSTEFSLPRKFSIGFFGAGANFIEEKIILTRMAPNSPAEDGHLAMGDQITGINGVPISLPPQYGGELMKYLPGDSISIQGIRDGKPFSLMIGLRPRPQIRPHPAELFDGGKSIRLDGFSRVFSHDALIRPEECGGPLFDADGHFYGINIARFSRTSTLALPVGLLYSFIGRSL